MPFRSNLCRILLRPRSLRSHSTGESPLASDAANSASHTSGAFTGGKPALWLGSESHFYYSIYRNRAAVANGLLSLQQMHTDGHHPSSASGIRAMHSITTSYHQHSGRIQSLKSKASLGFQKGGGSRLYSGVPGFPFPVLWTLIGANVAVFTMWNTLNYRFMLTHFAVSMDSVLSGRLYTILTSAFSQQDVGHLLANLIGLYFFGGMIARNFGDMYLLTLYLSGAIGGSLGHLFFYSYVHPWLQGIPPQLYSKRHSPAAMGASGAVTTLILLDIFLYPKQMILFYFIIPLPAAVVGAIIIGRDLWLARQSQSEVGVGAHLGGAVVAFLAFLAKIA